MSEPSQHASMHLAIGRLAMQLKRRKRPSPGVSASHAKIDAIQTFGLHQWRSAMTARRPER
eukprot:scaffold7029_cov375-Pinguiococcus_pyrenoidosus.AAC.12